MINFLNSNVTVCGKIKDLRTNMFTVFSHQQTFTDQYIVFLFHSYNCAYTYLRMVKNQSLHNCFTYL